MCTNAIVAFRHAQRHIQRLVAYPTYTSAPAGGLVIGMPLVFVSHKSEDESKVRRIVDSLERQGVSCWVSYRDIPAGGHFPQEITQALHRCDTVLVYVTQAMLDDPKHIERELTIADNRHVRIVPLFESHYDDLRSLEFYLSVPQRYYLTGDYEQTMRGLATSLRGTPSTMPIVSSKPTPRGRRRTLWIAAIASVAAVLLIGGGVIAWVILQRQPSNPPVVAKPVEAPPPPAPTPSPAPTIEQYQAALNGGDYAKARQIAEQMFDCGNADAAAEVGVMYLEGLGVPRDELEAERWFIKSADKGSAAGRSNLSALRERWKLLPPEAGKDPDAVVRRAENGNADAQYQLFLMYTNGVGVEVNPTKGLIWLRRAADSGHIIGMNDLGVCYLNGAGVPQDLPRARTYFARAAAAGFEMAKFNLQIVDEQLAKPATPDK